MESLKLKEEIYIIKKLNEDLDFYNELLKEVVLYLCIRNEVKDKFKSMNDDFYKYIQIGEILDDITRNYIEYDSITNNLGEIIDFKKVYCLKAEQEILSNKMLLMEIEEDYDVDVNYIEGIKHKLDRYINKNIFYELITIQELLLKIINPLKEFRDEIDVFLKELMKFNDLIELDKNKYLNSFCYENIENSKLVKSLVKIYNDYIAVEVISNVNEVELISFFSRWNNDKSKMLLERNSEVYFNIIKGINKLQELSDDLLNIEKVQRQIELIDELKQFLIKFY